MASKVSASQIHNLGIVGLNHTQVTNMFPHMTVLSGLESDLYKL